MWLISTAILASVISVSPDPEPKELVPGIFIAQGVVEFDAKVAIDCHHEGTPDVYLEMFITAPDSREHESLLVATIKPSSLHAALLAAGFEPGAPMSFNEKTNTRIRATGDQLIIEVIIDDHEPIAIETWVVHVETAKPLQSSPDWTTFVFAGSKLTDRGYAADADATIAALTAFTTETIAPAWTLSPDAATDEPVWIANRDLVPEQGKSVRVRITAPPEKTAPADQE
ncbi:MAG: hypothetical protein JKY96_09045 [Phycisphaerales bacterium]|nr:hypothetical protein [Phycisphaerales bacterium]